jgi:hypothetical protein
MWKSGTCPVESFAPDEFDYSFHEAKHTLTFQSSHQDASSTRSRLFLKL